MKKFYLLHLTRRKTNFIEYFIIKHCFRTRIYISTCMLRIYGGEIHKYRSISKVYDSVTGLNARRDDLGSLGTQFDERFAWSNCVYRFDWLKALGNIFWGGSIERLIFVRGRGRVAFCQDRVIVTALRFQPLVTIHP